MEDGFPDGGGGVWRTGFWFFQTDRIFGFGFTRLGPSSVRAARAHPQDSIT